MKIQRIFLRQFVLALLLSCWFVTSMAVHTELDITVGIVAYQRSSKAARPKYESLFRELQTLSRSGAPVRFRIAYGTYEEVVDWHSRGLTDLVLATPGVFSALRFKFESIDERILATLARGPLEEADRWAEPDRKKGLQAYYRSVAVVHESVLERWGDDLNMAGILDSVVNGVGAENVPRLDLVYVDPFSMSGRILPEYLIKEMVNRTSDGTFERLIDEDKVERIYASAPSWHGDVLETLCDPKTDENVVAVGFVGDFVPKSLIKYSGSTYGYTCKDKKSGLKPLPFEALSQKRIPMDVLLGRSGIMDSAERTKFERVGRLIRAYEHDYKNGEYPSPDRSEALSSEKSYFVPKSDDLPSRYDSVRSWFQDLLESYGSFDRMLEAQSRVGLEDISELLESFEDTTGKPHRLAIVFSGGGAKCAYQFGAIGAIEEKLKDEIELVVGTSGGAINALPVAMGAAMDSKSYEITKAVWTGLDRRAVAGFPRMTEVLHGLSVGAVVVILAYTGILVVRWIVLAVFRTPYFGGKWAGACLLVLGVAGLVVDAWDPQWGDNDWTPQTHTQIWMIATQLFFSALFVLVVGLWLVASSFLYQRAKEGQKPSIRYYKWFVDATLVAVAVVILFVQAWNVLFGQSHLLDQQKLEAVVADGFTCIVEDKSECEVGTGGGEFNDVSSRERLRDLSCDISRDGRLKRDLVITASLLEGGSTDFPPDLYFYASADSKSESREGDARDWPRRFDDDSGISMDRFPAVLLDAVIGSASVYPAYPGRSLQHRGKQFAQCPGSASASEGEVFDNDPLILIDGGFKHNSPIEAAVLWGATHIILIEASPLTKRHTSEFFLSNVETAFGYLMDQAQEADIRSKDNVAVFTLRPDKPATGFLGFSRYLIEKAIDQGMADARGDTDGNPYPFHKALGRPVFTALQPDQT